MSRARRFGALLAVAAFAACGGGAPPPIIQQGGVIPSGGQQPVGAVQNGAGMQLTVAIDTLGNRIRASLRRSPSLRVAIAEFPDLRGTTSDLSRFISERMGTVLSADTRLTIIERRRLDDVLAELQFSETDLVDPNNARRLGQLLGADALVIGTLSDLGDRVELDGRVVEIESGRVIPGGSVTVQKDQTVFNMMRRGRQTPGQQN